ncbi:MAG: hypothetical protein WCQ49_03300 [Candidatus Saccharibacteria bacterium]
MSKEFDNNKFDITKNEDVFQGPNSSIDSVTLSSGGHALNLLRKKVYGCPVEFEFMRGPNWHTELKEKGYPVVPTYRYDAENRIEYLTDLRRGGTHQIIDFCNPVDYEKVYVSNMQELEGDMEELAKKAADDGLIINEPNISFDIELSSGIAKVLLVDLREIGYEPFYDGPIATREQVLRHDQEIMRGHIERLKAIALEEVQS